MVWKKYCSRVEKTLVYLLILLFPTQLAYHFWPPFSFVNGLRVDYLSPAVYLTDILIVMLTPFIVFQIGNLVKTKKVSFLKKRKVIIIVCALFVFVLANVYLSSEPTQSVLKWLALGKFSILLLYILLKKQSEIIKPLQVALYVSVLAFSLIGIWQFIINRTVGGALYYLGERSFSVSTPGIALITLGGKSFIRAYSTFSHPNSMAGFLVVGLVLFFHLNKISKLFKTKGIVVLLCTGALAFVLTFSLSACIGLALLLIFFVVQKKSTLLYRRLLLLFLISLIVLSFLIPVYLKDYKRQELSERVSSRLELADVSLVVLSKNPFVGVGLNNFIRVASQVRHLNKASYLQPVHNIFLLASSESGIIGLLFVYFLFLSAINKSSKNYLSLGLLFILITGFFDHYWFTLQQNLLLLSFYLGMVFKDSVSVKLRE